MPHIDAGRSTILADAAVSLEKVKAAKEKRTPDKVIERVDKSIADLDIELKALGYTEKQLSQMSRNDKVFASRMKANLVK